MTCSDPLHTVQAAQLDRLLARADTFALDAAVAERDAAREALARVNATRPSSAAVEVCRELVALEPHVNEGDQACFFCFERKQHRKDCLWRRARVITEQIERQNKRLAARRAS